MQIKDISKQLNVSVEEVVAFLQDQEGQSFSAESELSDNLVERVKRRFRSTVRPFEHGIADGECVVAKDVTVAQLADQLKCSANGLIVELLKMGIVANKNQLLKKDQVEKVLGSLGISCEQAVEESTDSVLEKFIEVKSSSGEESRLPIVTVVGHVDHGKTSLLDYLRKSKVAEKEKGGITQNVSAYEVATKQGNLVFLDTPGHEAFSLMRERGVLLADLVVLVVALDDGIKPQTVESIKKIQSFGAMAVVALNKVDKVKEDRVEIVKRQLADYGMLPDDWGGDVPCVTISAKTGQGVDEFLEVVRLQADILDLKTSLKAPARGFVLESMIERGRGAVATVILHQGRLCLGDFFICGDTVFGKVASMKNSKGESLKCVGPSEPVAIAGFASLPHAGDMLEAATSAQAKKRRGLQKKTSTSKNLSTLSSDEEQNVVKVIIKTATHLSKEALLSSLSKLKEEGVLLSVVDAGIGDINEGNIDLAATIGAVIYGLGVKVDKSALSRVSKKVDIRKFDIIYKLLEDVEQLLEKYKVKKVVEKQVGTARIKAIFNIKSIGVIAGASVESGSLHKGATVKVYRDGTYVGGGVIKTLQKERTTISTIAAGNDCAFVVDGFSDWSIGDDVSCFVQE